ncbi:hypothetical protein [Aerococcus christensenii]|uniref:hypothetical protein n=1 Tax=Aerococcus christensenii TaxID=87541 RepID=UPI003F43AFB4
MKEEKLVLKIKKIRRVSKRGYPRVRCTNDQFLQIQELALGSGISESDLAIKLIEFALDHVEIIEEEEIEYVY